MQLEPYVARVRRQLTAAAALGDDRTREVAAALAGAADAAVRLAILEAVVAAADEVTAGLLDLPGTPAVAAHLDGDDVQVTVTATAEIPAAPPREPDGDASARISLRLSEALKADVDAAAARDGVSVNTWLVRAASAALRGPAPSAPSRPTARRVTGWING